MLTLNLEELQRYFNERNSMSGRPGASKGPIEVEELEPNRLVVRVAPTEDDMRPGDLWSGPSQLRVLDSAGFMMTVAHLPPGSDALTADLAAKFLRPAPLSDVLRAEVRLLRLSRRASIMDVTLTSPAVADGPVTHATISFAPWVPRR